MGLKDSLVTMMGDFVELRRNPDFRSKTELSGAEPSEPVRFNPNRRHSLQITCGTHDVQPEQLVHHRTFSVNRQKQSQQKDKGKDDCMDSASLRQEPPLRPQSRRQKQRRASEPVNLLGLALWARGSGHKRGQKIQQSPLECAEPSGSPPASPAASSGGGGGRSPGSSLSKSSKFARFFAQHNAIEEGDELEADMDGQRRQSQSQQKRAAVAQVEQQRYATVIRL